MNSGSSFLVPCGFEAAHEEWLARGGKEFRRKYVVGPHFDYYQTRFWALVRQAVLARDSATCFRCCGPAGNVHHLNYNFTGEDHFHPESLVSVCGACHQLVEYARLAESLISRIERRIRVAADTLKTCARLLEYRDELTELRRLFTTKTPYRNRGVKSEAESAAVVSRFEQKRQAYEEQAANLISTWSEKERADFLVPMLRLEIQNCRKFVAEVLESVSPIADRIAQQSQPAEAAKESKSRVAEVEALVVGIKFHRGHLDGVALGDRVQLVREPNNAYDANAVRVNLQTGEALGYLTKEFAAVFANLVGVRSDVQAQVSKIVRDKVYVVVTLDKPDSQH